MRIFPSVVPAAMRVPACRAARDVTPMRPPGKGAAPSLSMFRSISHIGSRLGVLLLLLLPPPPPEAAATRTSSSVSEDPRRASHASHTLTHPSSQLDTSKVPCSSSPPSSVPHSSSGRSSRRRGGELSIAMLDIG